MQPSSVALPEMLDARERRAALQRALLERYRLPLVCLSMNIPGAIKRTPCIRLLFDEGLRRFDALGFPLRRRLVLDAATGCEAFLAVHADAGALKAAAVRLEEGFPAARLLDFDVLLPGGEKLSRGEPRRCLLCDRPAAECARSRNHGLAALVQKTQALLHDFTAALLAQDARDALLSELYATPKPGLVDGNNSGAHDDMDLPLFEASAEALLPYFRQAVLHGLSRGGMAALRRAGRAAEKAMFAATRGVNTHKGMVYSMGLLLSGMGRALAEGGDAVAHAAALAREDAEAMLLRARSAPDTNGARVLAAYGARGAQGEAAAGFPHALLALERISFYRAQNAGNPAALALCDLMAVVEDTNLLHRGGPAGLAFAQAAAARIGRLPMEEREAALLALDGEMIARRLSPGGSADLLALGLLLGAWAERSGPLLD